jgi:hypothetical protein
LLASQYRCVDISIHDEQLVVVQGQVLRLPDHVRVRGRNQSRDGWCSLGHLKISETLSLSVAFALPEHGAAEPRSGWNPSRTCHVVLWAPGGDERVVVFTEYVDTQTSLAGLTRCPGYSGGEPLGLLGGGIDTRRHKHLTAALQPHRGGARCASRLPATQPARASTWTSAAGPPISTTLSTSTGWNSHRRAKVGHSAVPGRAAPHRRPLSGLSPRVAKTVAQDR